MLIKGWLVIANLAELGEAICCLKVKILMNCKNRLLRFARNDELFAA